MAKILKLNAISPLADGIFANYEYGDGVENPEGIMVRSAAMAEYAVGSNLLGVARAGAGTNNIPSAEYAEKGIVVFNTPGANANAVKELVLCELFLGGRKIVDAIDWAKTLKGEGANVGKLVEKGKSKFVGCEILGKTLGVIGMGAIGAAVANSAAALGMKILAADPFVTADKIREIAPLAKLVTNEEIFAEADFITVHVPLTADTKAMFNADTLAKMKDGAVLINNSRGELVDDAAVIAALESGKLARYITDFPTDNLIGVKNAVCVPHLGASTPEAEDNCAIMAANQLVDYIENGNITHGVNYPSVALARSGKARVCVLCRNQPDLVAKITSALGGDIVNMAAGTKGGYGYIIIDVNEDKPATKALDGIDGIIKVRVV